MNEIKIVQFSVKGINFPAWFLFNFKENMILVIQRPSIIQGRNPDRFLDISKTKYTNQMPAFFRTFR